MNRSLSPAAAQRFRAVSLKNKIFFSIIAVILIISAAIALMARWILVDNLLARARAAGDCDCPHDRRAQQRLHPRQKPPRAAELHLRRGQAQGAPAPGVLHLRERPRGPGPQPHPHPAGFPESLRLANQRSPGCAKSVRLCRIGDQHGLRYRHPRYAGDLSHRHGARRPQQRPHRPAGRQTAHHVSGLPLGGVVIIFVITHRLANTSPCRCQAHPAFRGARQGQLRREIGSRSRRRYRVSRPTARPSPTRMPSAVIWTGIRPAGRPREAPFASTLSAAAADSTVREKGDEVTSWRTPSTT